MKLDPPETLASIASLINAEYQGLEEFPVTGINEINSVQEGDLVFVDHEKYYTKALNSVANTILINKKVDCPESKALIFSDEPFDDFNRLTDHFTNWNPAEKMISDDANIDKNKLKH